MLLPARSSRRHTVRTKCCFLPAPLSPPPSILYGQAARKASYGDVHRASVQTHAGKPCAGDPRKPTIRNGGQGYGTEFQSEIWTEFRHSNSSLGASKRLRDLESSLGERLQNSRNLVLLKAVRWRASRCCVVRMPFSAPLLPGVGALAWGRARTGDENGWWSAALGGVAVRLPPPRRELARAPAGWRACASLGWTTCPWTATLARSRTLSRCRSGKGRLWALRAGDLTATVGTATVRSFQASLTDISVRTRGSLCVCV